MKRYLIELTDHKVHEELEEGTPKQLQVYGRIDPFRHLHLDSQSYLPTKRSILLIRLFNREYEILMED